MAKLDIRTAILDAGLKLFHQNGYHATGVQDIARAAGVPKGSFYHYFDSKEALGAEAVERYGASGTRRLVLADRAIAPQQRLRDYFCGLSDNFSGNDFIHGCLLGNLSAELGDSSPLIRERLAAVYRIWTDAIAGAIRDGKADGSIASAHAPDDLAVLLLDAWAGAVLRARVAKDRQALDVFLELGLEMALAGPTAASI
ncbi:TetR/AcrR family transcriptional regulator [Rugamonas sp.]|uniref:TetR/AcrR family transcriptional regulator n=1 Tax=Rugamonas sp. TaxID=1926287 RepID=UPI0025F0F0BA|nr:TetR/AcrR family transcriptional regulator [Rugamonas sp.]